MKAESGIWKISRGKGNRIYINCEDEGKVMHPQQLCGNNGLGIYGYETLKDLAVAILLFEKEKQESESIAKSADINLLELYSKHTERHVKEIREKS